MEQTNAITSLPVKRYIHDGLGLLLAWTETVKGDFVYHFSIVSLCGFKDKDLDVVRTVAVVGDCSEADAFKTVRALAVEMGMDLTGDEFESCCDSLENHLLTKGNY